jgi:hypothetical protein
MTAMEFCDLASGQNDRCDPQGILEAALEHAADALEVISAASINGSAEIDPLANAASLRARTVVKVVRRMCTDPTAPEREDSAAD